MPEVNDQEGKELIFQEGPLRLSRKTIRAFNRTYAIRRVEKVGVRRDPLYIALGIAAPLIGFVFSFWPYLYWYEITLALVAAIGGIRAAASIGVLYIQAGAAYGVAAVWWIKPLRRFQAAISDALES